MCLLRADSRAGFIVSHSWCERETMNPARESAFSE